MTSSIGPRSGTKTISVANTPEPLSATSIPCGAVGIKGSASVRVGDENVNASGWPLTEPFAMDVDDLRKVYVYGPAGSVVYWIITKQIQ